MAAALGFFPRCCNLFSQRVVRRNPCSKRQFCLLFCFGQQRNQTANSVNVTVGFGHIHLVAQVAHRWHLRSGFDKRLELLQLFERGLQPFHVGNDLLLLLCGGCIHKFLLRLCQRSLQLRLSCVVNICSRHQFFQCVFQRIDLVLQRLLLSRRQACLLLFQVVNTRFELRSLPNIGSVFRCVRWLFAKGGFGGFLFCVHLAHAWGSLNAFLNQRLVFRCRPKVFEFLNGQFLLFSGKLLRCRVCAFGFDLGFFFKRFFLGNQRVIARLQISQIFRLGAFCCQLLFCFFGALRFDFSRCFVFKARSFSCLGFSGAALKRATNRRDGPAKHCATNEAVDVLFACFRISDAQASLQTLKRLLGNLS